MRPFIKAGCMLLFLAANMPAQRMASTYANLQAFFDTCPQNDPYTPIIRRDFQILRDQVAVGDIACTEPYSQMPATEVTDELSVIQTLRYMYYMDMGRSGYLPWTPLRLYDWVKSRIAGVNISTPLAGGDCCFILNGLKYISVGSLAAVAAADGTTVAFQAHYRQTPDGQAANVGLFAHEARHTEGNGYPHVTGCPDFPTGGVFGCDETYDETNISAYGIQYYLAKQMLTGGINLGYSCDPTTQAQLGAAFQSLADVFPGRFVTNAPPSLSLPAAPGGACIPASTFTLISVPSGAIGAGASFNLGISASNAQAGWTADSTVPWITPISGMNSVGSGQAVFAISQNPPSSGQPGTVVASGIAVSVTCPSTCTLSTTPTIAFGALNNVTIAAAPFTVSAMTSSGLPVTFTTTTTAVCTVSGSTVTIVGTGTCSITAASAGNAIYGAATPVTQSFTVTGQTSQTISFGALSNVTLGVAPFTIGATVSSGLAVTLTSTTTSVCSLSGSNVTIVSAGTCSIAASQAGNATYAAAASVIRSFPVTSGSQVIWTLNATFADGGTAYGYFVFDPNTKTFPNWDVSATGGNTSLFPPFDFTPVNSFLSFEGNDPSGRSISFFSFTSFQDTLAGQPENLILGATLPSPFSGTGGPINITPGAAGNYSRECFDCNPYRPIVSGALSPGYLAPIVASGGQVPAAVTPAAGNGPSPFTFTFSDPNGYQSLGVVNVLINNVLDGRHACYLAYSQPLNVLYLVGDDGGTLSAGSELTSSGSTGDSQCTVSWGSAPVTASGNTLTLTLTVSFSAGFAGNKVTYMAAGDVFQDNSGWRALGVWQVPISTPAGPWVTGMSPNSSSNLANTYTFTFTDTNSFQDITVANILVNTAIDARHGCYVAFVPATSSVLLVDDAGDAGGPYSGMVLPGSGSVSNSQCMISGIGSSVNGSGNTLTLTLAITFTQSFAGNQVFFLSARNNNGQNSNWQSLGTVAVP